MCVAERDRVEDLYYCLKRLVAKHGYNEDGTPKDWQEYIDAREALIAFGGKNALV